MKNLKKYRGIAIATLVMSIPSLIVLFMFAYKVLKASMNPDGTASVVAAAGAATVLLCSIFSLVYLVLYIISIVGASKLTEKTPMILLIVGLFISIVGFVGLILLIVQLSKGVSEAKPEPIKPKSDEELADELEKEFEFE